MLCFIPFLRQRTAPYTGALCAIINTTRRLNLQMPNALIGIGYDNAGLCHHFFSAHYFHQYTENVKIPGAGAIRMNDTCPCSGIVYFWSVFHSRPITEFYIEERLNLIPHLI